jgi:toxin ParE1/3/4
MLAVRWSDEAIGDLVEIVSYIEVRNRSAAQRLHDDIVQTVERLPQMPFLFRPGRIPGTRELVVRPNYIVVYKVGEPVIDVLRVLHASRQYP